MADAEEAGEEPAAFVRASIVNPDEHVANGYSAGIMPKNYGETLTPKEIDDLVNLLTRVEDS